MFKNIYDFFISTLFFCLLVSPDVKANTISIGLNGHIKDKCEINFISGNKIQLSDKKEQSLPFDLYCNRPLGITLTSLYGGLKNQEKGINITEKYNLTLEIDAINLNELTNSSQLALSKTIKESSGVIPFSQQGEIKVALENSLLYAGYYKDVIKIEVFPSIDNVTK